MSCCCGRGLRFFQRVLLSRFVLLLECHGKSGCFGRSVMYGGGASSLRYWFCGEKYISVHIYVGVLYLRVFVIYECMYICVSVCLCG